METDKNKNKEKEASTANTTVQHEIIDVWEENFEEEMDKLAELIDKYPFVAMDTEFPGVCIKSETLIGYQMIKANVDALKLIQVGVSLCDIEGNQPQPVSTWQFNLRFDLSFDRNSPESISMLKEAGINFAELAERGIDPLVFADGMLSSGLVLNENIHWITFHGAFDFGYLMKTLSNTVLPPNLEKFKSSMKTYFANIYDIKILLKEVTELKSSSLSKLASDLDQRRSGTMHQAGSDADLTLRCFFKLKEFYFKSGIPSSLSNKVFGLNNEYGPQPQPARPTTINPLESLETPSINMFQQMVNQQTLMFPSDYRQPFYYAPHDAQLAYSPYHHPFTPMGHQSTTF